MHSNRILSEVVQGAVIEAGLPREAVSYLTPDRRELDELLEQRRYVDLVIPRGGEDLKDYLMERSKIPVIYAAGGNCHVYVDAAADLGKAVPIIVNAKCQRPGVCNAAETLLVHRDVAAEFLPRAVEELKRRGVELVVDKAAADVLGDPTLKRANKTHYETEFLALKLAVRVVDSLDEALEHIATYGTRHSEAIVTEDLGAARRFTAEVDAACVYVNASTRFTDGGEFGLGAEMGISTQKLHARGPIALQELTCVKYELWGDGQVRP
jgi:glutamate-5-semialdehyde dehydrogenase